MDYQLTDNASEFAREDDKYWSAAIGATYFFNRSVYLSVSYDYNKYIYQCPV